MRTYDPEGVAHISPGQRPGDDGNHNIIIPAAVPHPIARSCIFGTPQKKQVPFAAATDKSAPQAPCTKV
jgi:hypothetical protein